MKRPIAELPAELKEEGLTLEPGGKSLLYTYDARSDDTGIPRLLGRVGQSGVEFRDLSTEQSSLEEIFVSLVRSGA